MPPKPNDQQLSAADRKFIIGNANLGAQAIAEALGKDLNIITEYLDGAPKGAGASIENPVLAQLRADPEFKPLKSAYYEDEISYFEYKYIEYMSQMNYDVEPTEKNQIFQLIELEIMMQRNKAAVKRLKDRARDVERRMRSELAKSENDRDTRQLEKYQMELDNVLQLDNGSYEELLKLQGQHSKLTKEQMGTRAQRLDKSYSKTSWKDKIKEWADEKERAKKAKLAAITRLSYERELKRLTEYYEYPDGMVDQPVLNLENLHPDAEFPKH
jgi:hypothetical protein